jgi:putative sterol carrier protein
MTIDGNDFVKMLKGELRASSAFISGNLKIKGDVGFAIRIIIHSRICNNHCTVLF